LAGVDWNRSCSMNTFFITLGNLARIWVMLDMGWSKGHGFGNTCFTSHFTRGLCGDWITGERAGPLGGCSPRMCRLRTDGWPPVSKYWMYRSHTGDMGPISLVVYCRQKLGLGLLLLWLRVGEKLDRDLQISHPVCWGCSQEFLFLGSSGIHPNLSMTRERLLYIDRMRYVWSGIIHGLSVGCVWHVSWVFTTGCISIQIIVTLGYE
jgi:hypothetical protein